MKNILIIGASGFIGQSLLKGLKNYNIDTYRGRSVTDESVEKLKKVFEGRDIIINLSGKSLFTIWSKANKRKIYNSRIETAKKLVQVIMDMQNPPSHFLNASAIGIYKPETLVDEYSESFDNGFLSRVVKDWETCLEPLKEGKTRITILRFGIVLGKNGGAYKEYRRLTKYNLAAFFNKGLQSLSFICIHDLVNAVDFVIREKIEGVVNIVSPEPTTYKEFLEKLKNKLGGVLIWPVPGIVAKIVPGETSDLVLKGHIVKPLVLLENNFNFEFSDIQSCINKIEG